MIVVVTKSLNEEQNIEKFCLGYDFADKLLVADGGSTDRTVELAQGFNNVVVRDFDLRIEIPDDPVGFMNPEPQHLNFCIDWATEEGADWIILDGCDCWPNPKLRQAGRKILAEVEEPMVLVQRLYIWGQDEVFVDLSQHPSIWAWRPAEVKIRWEEPKGKHTCFDTVMLGGGGPRYTLPIPYVCLHYFCPNEETVQLKMKRYAAWGHKQVHPLKAFGKRVPLPKEAIEE